MLEKMLGDCCREVVMDGMETIAKTFGIIFIVFGLTTSEQIDFGRFETVIGAEVDSSIGLAELLLERVDLQTFLHQFCSRG